MLVRLAGIVKESVVDGPGIRMVIFVQGCPHHCPGCHNPDSHDPTGGYESSAENIIEQLPDGKLVSGLTFSGGEPFQQAEALVQVAKAAKLRGLSIVTYTGYRYELLLETGIPDPAVRELLSLTDVLVDGPYEQESRDISLAFRGSTNQRLIDVPQSLATGKIVNWIDASWEIV